MIDTYLDLNNLIKENSNLVYSVCSKYYNYAEKEDLYQAGMVGLINAYNNFDKSKNVKFSTYAFPYIVGEISKTARENKNIKISKDIIKLGKKINEYIEKHKSVRGYEPSIKDMSLMFGISEEKIIYAKDACLKARSLYEVINDDGKELTLLDVTSDNKNNISSEEMLDLKEAFKYLNVDEKKLLIDRYYNNLTQSEVAKLMGVNQVYVSRLEKKVLTKMKNKMVS